MVRQRKRLDVYDLVARYETSTFWSIMLGLGLLLGWLIFYTTSFNITGNNPVAGLVPSTAWHQT